ncbi:isoaspartyl peptidase/L-asparaginase isoform X1 [Callorhinchus milii]|uniref:Isoaspartyl peptidase/L-asparaginase n=1 Tax=Callorhinchus milii TaxID=7868 RepID=A0A4W3IU73_CALMI|nr:isoaspartyl peptidase/L-asparaginase isoform X1 [Callorhinchus milii]XP_007902386.1 isoaspartyl peptidase/L-asparaginase isoform X1 [Callorhinchus milii]XP_042189418.1 isoaspartyl peptidase/L-asparaginase isoform X1 [Callorhinchus milii]|eukprot:gi/632971877/ref/XP_007902385.1/ PREDICTED: isoaspartyl peptidase/L-asparaginase-like isoform X1 [Callorhinchus milii]
MSAGKPVIVVHGGCGVYLPELMEGSVLGVRAAALKGFCVLQQGGSALDAVEVATVALEDNPLFNAGHGAVLNERGEIEFDAIIMDGKSLNAGAVSAVKNIANPIKLARLVMEKTKHVMLTDQGASQFAKAMGIPEVPMESLITEKARKQWETNLAPDANPVASQIGLGTVGAVAMDCEGNLACATSTGGITNKMVGRVGDTPLIGSGGYADNCLGAVSTTGTGEAIMKMVLSRLILFYMEQGMTPAQAADVGLQYMLDRVHSPGGLIVVNGCGEWAAKFKTANMSWAAAQGEQVMCGIAQGEVRTAQISDLIQQ